MNLRATALVCVVLAAGSLGGCKSCCKDEGNETAVEMKDVPASVMKTLERESAGGKIKEVEKETKDGRIIYSADVTINGEDWDLTVGQDGQLLSKEKEK